ncbi:MAG: M23 family metallopeptidase [Ruminococcus sp.]|nr:M23 family metallopeptidase [Ruminococcus sp.]
MNKNIFSNTKKDKSPKGFYTALAISALMIGSACYFSYSQNENKKSPKQSGFVSEEAVDRKITNVPKQTTAITFTTSVTTTTQRPITTTQTAVTTPAVTIPALDPIVAEPPKEKTPTQDSKAYHAPLDNTSNIVNMFSGSELVKNATTGSWQTHNGTDIAASVGDNVYAIASGDVIEVSDDALWGTIVVIDHKNGYLSRYCNLGKDLNLQQGSSVKAGDIIGAVGDTADIESGLEAHLHIEIEKDGKYINPLELFANN